MSSRDHVVVVVVMVECSVAAAASVAVVVAAVVVTVAHCTQECRLADNHPVSHVLARTVRCQSTVTI